MPHLKGEDLLKQAMLKLMFSDSSFFGQIELLIFGQYQPSSQQDWYCKTHWLGPVRDDHVMTLIYSAADVMVVPSRQDNLPNTAVEAHACGVPVVAFNIGGLPDIIDHRQSGWLADAFDTDRLAEGLLWILADSVRWDQLSSNARKIALDRFSPNIVIQQYLHVYEQARLRHQGHHG